MVMTKKGINLSNSIGASFKNLIGLNKDDNNNNSNNNNNNKVKQSDKSNYDSFEAQNLQDGEDF